MTGWEWAIIGFLVVLCAYAIFIPRMGALLAQRREQESVAADQPPPSLDDPATREAMRILLSHYGIVGNCDIRDGKVYAARSPGKRNAMAYALMSLYNREVERSGNPNLALCIPREGRFWPLGIDMSLLREIAQMLEDADGR